MGGKGEKSTIGHEMPVSAQQRRGECFVLLSQHPSNWIAGAAMGTVDSIAGIEVFVLLVSTVVRLCSLLPGCVSDSCPTADSVTNTQKTAIKIVFFIIPAPVGL